MATAGPPATNTELTGTSRPERRSERASCSCRRRQSRSPSRNQRGVSLRQRDEEDAPRRRSLDFEKRDGELRLRVLHLEAERLASRLSQMLHDARDSIQYELEDADNVTEVNDTAEYIQLWEECVKDMTSRLDVASALYSI
jgi:hypothetical protein